MGTLRTQTYDLKFTKARFIIADNKLSAVFISRNNTQINFYQGEPSSPVMLEVVIKNMSFEYGLRYEVDTSPDFFDDRGTGRLAVENMTLVIRFSVVPRDGRAQFEVNQTSVMVENYHAEFKGTHEFADGVTIVLDAFKPVFKKEILSMATRKISKML